MSARRGRRQNAISEDRPAVELARYLQKLRQDASVTYRQMAITVPCTHNSLSQNADGRLTTWPPVETFLKALRAAAPPGAVPADAERHAKHLWQKARDAEESRKRVSDQNALTDPLSAISSLDSSPEFQQGTSGSSSEPDVPVQSLETEPIAGNKALRMLDRFRMRLSRMPGRR